MTKYEDLLTEYESSLHIEERPMVLEGLYGNGYVWLNESLPQNRKCCILAEEIGHYETSAGDILDQRDIGNQKQELLARRWAYKKLLPPEEILRAASAGCTELWEFAEYLDVDEAFMRECFTDYGLI